MYMYERACVSIDPHIPAPVQFILVRSFCVATVEWYLFRAGNSYELKHTALPNGI